MTIFYSLKNLKSSLKFKTRVYNRALIYQLLASSIASLLFLTSCSSPIRLSCSSTDWYELGRQQGSMGYALSLPEETQKACTSDHDRLDAHALFESGHSLGLSEFCTENNGFRLAKMNVSYKKGLCPSLLESNFLKGYQAGLQAQRLSKNNEPQKN